MMSQRFIAVIFVAVTVLFCQSGGLVLNAICPYARAQHEICHGMTHDVASHQQQRANDEAFEASDDGATCNHCVIHARNKRDRSEEHTSELQSHSFISYAVFCLKKK